MIKGWVTQRWCGFQEQKNSNSATEVVLVFQTLRPQHLCVPATLGHQCHHVHRLCLTGSSLQTTGEWSGLLEGRGQLSGNCHSAPHRQVLGAQETSTRWCGVTQVNNTVSAADQWIWGSCFLIIKLKSLCSKRNDRTLQVNCLLRALGVAGF